MGGYDPLKFPDVYLFVMVTVSLATSALTALPVITKEKLCKSPTVLVSTSSSCRGRAQQDAPCARFISFRVNFQVAVCANK